MIRIEYLQELLGYPTLEMVRTWCKENGIDIEKLEAFELVTADAIFLTPGFT